MILLLSIIQALLAALSEQTLQSQIAMTVTTSDAQPLTYKGDICLHADSFRLTLPMMQAAYNGTEMYIYQEEADELTVSIPTEQELLQINPLRYAKAIIALCHIDTQTSADKTQTILTLTPQDSSSELLREMQSLTMRIRNEDAMPLYIDMQYKNSGTILRFNNPQYVTSHAPFTLSQEDFPDAYFNDLR